MAAELWREERLLIDGKLVDAAGGARLGFEEYLEVKAVAEPA